MAWIKGECPFCGAKIYIPSDGERYICPQCKRKMETVAASPSAPNRAKITEAESDCVEEGLEAPLLDRWKTSVGMFVLGLVCSYALGSAAAFGTSALMIAATVIVMGLLYWTLMGYPSLFTDNPCCESPRTASFLNAFFGGLIFGALWNTCLTKRKKGISQYVYLVVILAICVSSGALILGQQAGTSFSFQGNDAALDASSKPSSHIGGSVRFGTYEQDCDFAGQEPIEWHVVDEKDGKVLLISDYALSAYAFPDRRDTPKEERTRNGMNGWLNGEFKSTAFTPDELALIDGNVFCFDLSDTVDYHSVTDMHCKPTAFAISQGVTIDDKGLCDWLIWSYDFGDGDSMFVSKGSTGIPSDYDGHPIGIRPAIWVDDQVIGMEARYSEMNPALYENPSSLVDDPEAKRILEAGKGGDDWYKAAVLFTRVTFGYCTGFNAWRASENWDIQSEEALQELERVLVHQYFNRSIVYGPYDSTVVSSQRTKDAGDFTETILYAHQYSFDANSSLLVIAAYRTPAGNTYSAEYGYNLIVDAEYLWS